ncbi:AAA family ATPase [Paenibacillus albiflavus]|uniref:AAA family ATPase n=1 Tax=Paenibacillus albiflavus TaxID=2545760 RepID=A0A4R4ENI8_9BACL|nr:AAA family ATPase [Paenibacillus albiflavus]TCZ81173.1 AAA family ATPase [Paenibacillus albiflavus]
MFKRVLKFKFEILIGVAPILLGFIGYITNQLFPTLMFGAVVTAAVLLMKFNNGGMTGLLSGSSHKNKSKHHKPIHLSFDQIGGQDRAKNEIIEALDFIIRREEIAKLGIRPLKGLLLTGPPGTGKTLLARASAHYTNSVFVAASGSEFVEMYVGVGASRIRDLFKEARVKAQKEKKENAIIFIDEIDVIGGKREGGQQREYDQTLNQLLTEMDGIHSGEGIQILIIAATNRKEMLDSALLRPGRFDRQIEVDLPDKSGRMAILKIHAKNKPVHPDVSWDKIAEQTFGFSGAQLESVMNEGAIYTLRDEVECITSQHLAYAIDKVMLGERTDRKANEEEKIRVAYHELGHAILAETVRENSVSQVSLTPRGKALGYVRHNPPADHYLYTKAYIEEQIMIALGGAAAEEVVYGGRSTGSRNDFEKAMELVRLMVDCGLTTLGIVDAQMVPMEQLLQANVSILDDLFTQTKEVLIQNKRVLDQGLAILLEEEVLSGDEFRNLLKISAA